MNIKKISIKASAASLLAAALAVGVACGGGGGVSQEDFDALDARVTAVQTQLGGLQAVANQLTPELVTQLTELVERPMIGSPGGFLQRALAGEFRGSDPVTITGPCRDACETTYVAVLQQFTEATGIPVTYSGSAQFETEIQTQIAAGTPPDIADFPQPGAVQALVADDAIINVADYISVDWLNQQYNDGWVGASTFQGPDGEDFVSGVWSRTNAKSYIWYVPDAFEAAGYEIPETWDELVALTNQIREDGATPWCVGIESGTATGWAATDWTEDVLLRTTSLENYDRWTIPTDPSDRLLFDSPEVRRAISLWDELWFGEDGNVRGGRETVVATNFNGDSNNQLFSDPPGCYLFRQASFITGGWIDDLGLTPGEDFDAFAFPSIDAEYGNPFLVGGDLNVAFNNRPEVIAVLEFHATADALTPFLQQGGDLSPFRATRPEDYGSDVQRIAGELLASATAVRFDGSDLQPKEVGSGEFWSAITEYISGSIDLDTAVERIDDAWPN